VGKHFDIVQWFRDDLSQTIRRYTYLHSDVPTTEELEAVKRARERALLVIRMRWVLLALFALFGFYASHVYKLNSPEGLSLLHITMPSAAFAAAVVYNGWYHYSHRWLSNLRRVNLIQLLLDLFFVTIIVHYSGGAVSWFWTMYFLLILQATFLGESVYDAWTVGIGSALSYGAVLLAECYDVLPPVSMPFENLALQQDLGYASLKWMWVTSMLLFFAGLGSYMIREIQDQEDRLRQMVIKDGMTGLYNRSYFHLRLNSEVRRAEKYDRQFSLLILDVDDFKLFNDTYGHQRGDLLLQHVGRVLKERVRRSDTFPPYDMDIPCRVGGEEFAVIMPEATSSQSRQAAVRLLDDIASLEIEGTGATISIGVASFPEHGSDPDAIFKAADDAMYSAKRRGKNRVVVAGAAERKTAEALSL
jgi:diguanylate cyclase (GGDEF)-like protein